MRPSTQTTCSNAALWKLGLFVMAALLSLLLAACSSNHLAQALKENQGTFLTPLPAKTASQPASKGEALELAAAVPEDNLQEMRGTLGVYFFDYNFDINLVATPQVSVSSTFQAVLPDGSPAPTVSGTTASFKDNNVSYVAGPTNGGLSSQLLVTGRDNIVFANTRFNVILPNTSTLTSTVNVMPAATLTGTGMK